MSAKLLIVACLALTAGFAAAESLNPFARHLLAGCKKGEPCVSAASGLVVVGACSAPFSRERA
jgi:hypothetical protein